MAELLDIEQVTVGARKLTARVRVMPGMPLKTSEDIEATARVYYLAPAIATHTCLGDAGAQFQDCMGDTEVAHLMEHLAVEIMIETNLAGDIASGRTRAVPGEDRLFEIELSCPDDALTLGALSSAAFMMDWAFLHADQQAPDFAGTVHGLRNLVLGLRQKAEDAAASAAEARPSEAEAAAAKPDASAAEPAQPASEPAVSSQEAAGEGASPARALSALEDAANRAVERGIDMTDRRSGTIDTEGAHVSEAELGAGVLFGGAAAGLPTESVPVDAPQALGAVDADRASDQAQR